MFVRSRRRKMVSKLRPIKENRERRTKKMMMRTKTKLMKNLTNHLELVKVIIKKIILMYHQVSVKVKLV